MRLKQSLKKSSLVLFVLSLSACGTVPINDAEWCGDMGPIGASCVFTLSDKTRDVPKDQWDVERAGMLCTSSDSFANWKAALLKLCKESDKCIWNSSNPL